MSRLKVGDLYARIVPEDGILGGMPKQDRITDSDREILAVVVQAVLDMIPEHTRTDGTHQHVYYNVGNGPILHCACGAVAPGI